MAEKKKKLKKELAEHEAQKARKERRAKQLNHHCRIGRFATDLLKYAVRAQALAVALEVIVMIVFIVGFVAAVASAVTGKAGANVILGAGLGLTVRILLPLALLLSIASILALIAGFGYAMAGPKPARHISLLGLISGVLHLGVAAAQAVVAIRILTQGQFQVDPTQPIWQQAQPVFDLFGLVTDMPLLSEHPARFIWNYKVSWLGIIAGALEFVRLVSICLMAQIYAEEGKAPETGHRALKAAYRVFWLMLLAGLFRVAAAFAFDWVRPDDAFMQFVGLIVHGLITFGITMGLAISLYSLSNLLDDIRDLVDPVRFAATGEIYEF